MTQFGEWKSVTLTKSIGMKEKRYGSFVTITQQVLDSGVF